jgi:hypothetical protein
MYTVATFSRLETNSDGTPMMILTYTGNAGEKPVEYAYVQDLQVMPTADYIRGLAMDRIRLLNNNANFVIGATPNIGSILDTTTPLPAPAPSTFGAFTAASAPFSPGATPQDVFTITGSATRRVQVTRFGISTVQTTAGMNAWLVVKRSSANTGGTSVLVTAVPLDDSYPAATATVRSYTANPTAGTLVGTIWSGRIASPAPATALAGTIQDVSADRGGSITLTGTTDVLAWNLNGVALPPGVSVQAYVSWTEQ